MICKACGEEVTRTDHVVFIDGESYCRPLIERDYGSVEEFIARDEEPVEELDVPDIGTHAGAVIHEEW
jgi:hypothetical protein